MKTLPPDFTSFIQLYDYLKQNNPEYFRARTVRFITMNNSCDGKCKCNEYRISIACLERNCWRELQRMRLDEKETMIVIHQLQAQPFYSELNQKAADLLFKIKNNN